MPYTHTAHSVSYFACQNLKKLLQDRDYQLGLQVCTKDNWVTEGKSNSPNAGVGRVLVT
jgi:hypothetical protein